MILDPNILALDIKVQDRYRALLSKLGKDGVELTCVMLGDSDIDYELSLDMNNARILNTPYNTNGIKYPLIYNGAGKGLQGVISSFARKVETDGTVSSLYTYPTNTTLAGGRIPPSIENGYNWYRLDYTNDKMGYILYFQTLLDYYLDETTGLQKRLKEDYIYKITFSGSETVPTGWDVVLDETNGSMLLSKDSIAVSSTTVFDGEILITGKVSNNVKSIEFNY